MIERQDLGQRTANFAQQTRHWIRQLPFSPIFADDLRQVLRSSGSVAANYIEANESLGKKDCAMHLKICRKEAKESALWFHLLDLKLSPNLDQKRIELLQESRELVRIFHSIIQK